MKICTILLCTIILQLNCPAADLYSRPTLKLISFDVYNMGNVNKLQWTAENELATEYYIVECSTDGANWLAMQRVNCIGSGLRNKYAMSDTALSKITYYRLHQFFDDGSETFSPVKVIRRKKSQELIAYMQHDPSTGISKLYYLLEKDAAVKIQLINTSGVILNQFISSGKKGQNEVDGTMSTYPAGQYWLLLSTATAYQLLAFVKM